jgi:hypothetical protein
VISQQHGIVKQSVPAKPTRGKQVIYRFNGDPKDDEVISDRRGDMIFLKVGEILSKNGKQWRVAIVRNDFNMSASRTAIPIHRVFLTDKL